MVQSDPRAKCMLYNQLEESIDRGINWLVLSILCTSVTYPEAFATKGICHWKCFVYLHMLRRSWQIFYHHFQSLGGAINVTLCFPLLCYCFPLPWCLSQHCALCSNMPAALIIVALWHNHVLSDKWKNEWMNSFIRVMRITEMSSLIRPMSH